MSKSYQAAKEANTGPETDFVQLLDEKTGVVNLWQRTPDFLYGVQNAGQDHDIVLVASGLDIYDTWPFRKDIGGIAQSVAWPLPFFRIHDCRYKTAIIEVTNLTDPVSRWVSAWAAAHEVAHLIGTTQHDGEDDNYGGKLDTLWAELFQLSEL